MSNMKTRFLLHESKIIVYLQKYVKKNYVYIIWIFIVKFWTKVKNSSKDLSTLESVFWRLSIIIRVTKYHRFFNSDENKQMSALILDCSTNDRSANNTNLQEYNTQYNTWAEIGLYNPYVPEQDWRIIQRAMD